MPGSLLIINLRGGGVFQFDRFPAEIGTTDASNWETIETAGGLKPLFYGNREPQEVTIEDVMLDNTISNESIEPQIERLRNLMKPVGNDGAPPQLQIQTAGFKQRVVLRELRVQRNFFTPAGDAIRAQLALTFTEVASR